MRCLLLILIFFIALSSAFSGELQNANIEANSFSKSKLELLFKDKIKLGSNMSYVEVPRGIVISVSDDFLFSYDEVYCQLSINPNAIQLLNSIGEIMNSIDNKSNVEGHSENADLNLTEWEYSIIKADLIVDYLIKKYPNLQNKIMALGYGNFEPYSAEILNSNNPKLDNRVDFVIIKYEASR